MDRWITGILAAMIVALPLVGQEQKPADEKGNDRATQFREIQKDFQKAVPDARKALQSAKNQEEMEVVFKKLNKDFIPRIIKLVEADPTDKLSYSALVWSIQALPNVDGRVFDLLAKHWSKNEKIKDLCQMLAFNPQEGAKTLLQKVLDDNPDKDAKGSACFALAKVAADRADKGDAKAGAEAEKLYERVEKEFATVKLGRATLGEQAKGALFEIRHLAVGKTAPNVESENLEGKKVQLKDYQGKVVVLDIWATWCGPCKAMIPHEREMVAKLKDKPFALISISVDDKKDTVTDFLKDTKMPWEHWWNGPTGGIVKDWNVSFFPTIYVLDAKGVIRYKHIRGQDLEEAVNKLVAEAKK
jgi:thiol-disulfide isomerase/thioredoxin